MSEGTEAVKEAKAFIDRHKICPTCGRKKADLVITTVPKATLDQFIEFSNSEEFEGHRGFALKFLLDIYLGKVPTGLPELAEEVTMLSEKVNELAPIEQHKNVHTVNGKKLRIGG